MDPDLCLAGGCTRTETRYSKAGGFTARCAAWRQWLGLLVLGAALVPATAEASHFRFGNISWEPTGNPREIKFSFTGAFRRSGYAGTAPDGRPALNDVITEDIGGTNFSYGDGQNSGVLTFIVTAINPDEDYLIGEALDPATKKRGLVHQYSATAPPSSITAGISSSARIDNLNNRRGGDYALHTTVTLDGNRSPKTSLVPIVTVPKSQNATFKVPAADSDHDKVRFRLSTDAEAGGDYSPPNLAIDPKTGVVTWDTAAIDANTYTRTYWTVQVIVEDLDTQGNVKTQTPVDFFLRIDNNPGNNFPTAKLTPPGPFSVKAGQAVSFTVNAADADAGSTVTINSGTIPAGAITTPVLPLTGSGKGTRVKFTWAPPGTIKGDVVIVFAIADEHGSQTLASTVITVAPIEPAKAHTGWLADADGNLALGSILLNANQSFSGFIKIANKRPTFTGTLDSSGKATVDLPGLGHITIELLAGDPSHFHLVLTTTDKALEGTLARSPFSTARPSPQNGNYTMLLPPNPATPSNSAIPQGTGYGIVVIDKLGNFRVAGALSDGTRFGTGGGIQVDGVVPFYATLYGAPGGHLAGSLTLEEVTTSSFEGTLDWVKPSIPGDPFYSGGFQTSIKAIGSRLSVAAQNQILTLNASNEIQIDISGGNLISPISVMAIIPASGNPMVTRPVRSLTLVKRSGLFKGYVVHDDGLSRLFWGAVFQKQNLGGGFFLGPDKSGNVSLTP